MIQNRCGTALGLALTVLSTHAAAQANAAANRADTPSTGTAYTLWLLHHFDYDELQAGQLALANSESDAVKKFGRTLVTDHQVDGQKVLAAAHKLKVDLEPPVTGGDKVRLERMKKRIDELESLKGKQFDAAFSRLMVETHREIIGVVRQGLDDPQQEPIKPLLHELLPRLQAHQHIAEALVARSGTPVH